VGVDGTEGCCGGCCGCCDVGCDGVPCYNCGASNLDPPTDAACAAKAPPSPSKSKKHSSSKWPVCKKGQEWTQAKPCKTRI
jgi:hypothetical protein